MSIIDKKKNFRINFGKKKQDVCNNCGNYGHLFKYCQTPIISLGVVQFRMIHGKREYLMIRRKDTLGYIDFIRGKYFTHDKKYIINMMKQMTNDEKNKLIKYTFIELWISLWKNSDLSQSSYKSEENNSSTKFNILKRNIIDGKSEMTLLIDESNESETWIYPEWGFPKGRRNFSEKDYDCALREMNEETGYNINTLIHIKNIIPFEEVFIGSNYKIYKHKYYLMYMKYNDTLINDNFDTSEVSLMEWKTYEKCMEEIRPYNFEKKTLITNIENTLRENWIN
jgi:8-oxo-dGTP pyrophosphatase MutT (NUDIX family)